MLDAAEFAARLHAKDNVPRLALNLDSFWGESLRWEAGALNQTATSADPV